ncbi:hypothetical protein [Janthinobacterium sp. HLX7-2]|uniref:hypothetical protein n=1 Tax=Janthinobacterium sp. HLX7-2 TaxID=1259331 RepID=UPI003F2457A4
MKHLIDATRFALKDENWYAALALALTLPDICGRIAYPQLKKMSEKRTTLWFDKYLAPYYKIGVSANIQLMRGGDFYALRCAYLHQGEFDLVGHNAAKIVKKFIFHSPKAGGSHKNMKTDGIDGNGLPINPVVQLDISNFSEEVCVAVEQWILDTALDVRINTEVEALSKVHDRFVF